MLRVNLFVTLFLAIALLSDGSATQAQKKKDPCAAIKPCRTIAAKKVGVRLAPVTAANMKANVNSWGDTQATSCFSKFTVDDATPVLTPVLAAGVPVMITMWLDANSTCDGNDQYPCACVWKAVEGYMRQDPMVVPQSSCAAAPGG